MSRKRLTFIDFCPNKVAFANFVDMDDQTPKPLRRIRYKGTHPKSFKEKYKELQPENYAEDIAKVMQQGRTPAGMHRPICVNEILDFLQIVPGQIGLDATLG